MGYYMGVFNFFIVIPSIIVATILGFLVKEFFNSELIYAIVVGGIALILPGLLTLKLGTEKQIERHE
jgi:maltose/moltooligosaccharide transporter